MSERTTAALGDDAEIREMSNLELAEQSALEAIILLRNGLDSTVDARIRKAGAWLEAARVQMDLHAAKTAFAQQPGAKPSRMAKSESESPASTNGARSLTRQESKALKVAREILSEVISPDLIRIKARTTVSTIHTPAGPQVGAIVRLSYHASKSQIYLGFGHEGANRENQVPAGDIEKSLRAHKDEILNAFDETPEGRQILENQQDENVPW